MHATTAFLKGMEGNYMRPEGDVFNETSSRWLRSVWIETGTSGMGFFTEIMSGIQLQTGAGCFL